VLQTVTVADRPQFTDDMYHALLDQMADRLAMLTAREFMVASRTLRQAVDVLFLESVVPASPLAQ
jgi:hypothetical protein